jgi:hypothetical protein
MGHDVVISYAAEDKAVAEAVATALEQDGLSCWMALRDMVAGASWAEAVARSIQASQVMVLIFSDHANRSRYVAAEVEQAVASAIPILAYRVEAVQPSGAMAYLLATREWFDALAPPPESNVALLAVAIRRLLARHPQATPAPEGSGSSATGTIAFYPEGLLHKFGFGDGDIVADLIEQYDLQVHHHDLLIAVVERLVVPRLDQKVETYTIGATLHNPIRARTIDGDEAGLGDELTPEIIEIQVSAIIQIARTLSTYDEAE